MAEEYHRQWYLDGHIYDNYHDYATAIQYDGGRVIQAEKTGNFMLASFFIFAALLVIIFILRIIFMIGRFRNIVILAKESSNNNNEISPETMTRIAGVFDPTLGVIMGYKPMNRDDHAKKQEPKF